MELRAGISTYWPQAAGLLTIAAMAGTAVHAVMTKRDTRAAVGWLGLVWFAPVLGVILYWLFGVNRIRRQAHARFAERVPVSLPSRRWAVQPGDVLADSDVELRRLARLAAVTERVTFQPLLEGARIAPLVEGDDAYPEMLAAIESAGCSVSLCTYIFDNDPWGRRFRSALGRAVSRGVAVRVLIDAVGARYSFPSIVWGLRRDGVPVARFMRSLVPWRFRFFNLRNHRKILVVDGSTGFTGGMNIRAGNVLTDRHSHPVKDVHFRVTGPVVAELQRAFAEDWKFTTGETLAGSDWFPDLELSGTAIARGISDGPDEDFDKLRMVILGALACAEKSVRIATPYFLPDNEMAMALRVAALRGVDVQILLPEANNLRMVKWASMAGLEELAASGCAVFLSPPPFDHSKLMVVDGGWTLLGSANWDPRSLALNFEFNVECYDPLLAAEVERIFARKRGAAREISCEELRKRGFGARLRDRTFRMFAPYL